MEQIRKEGEDREAFRRERENQFPAPLANNSLVGLGEWTPDGWWKVLGPDGKLWCETSNQAEAIEYMRPGDVLYQHFVQKNQQWRPFVQKNQQWRPVGEFDQERGLTNDTVEQHNSDHEQGGR